MKKRSITDRLRYLSTEQKAVAIAACLSIIFCFAPWVWSESPYLKQRTWLWGFENIGAAGGYLITLMSVVVLALTVLPAWDIKLKLPWKNENIILVLSAESAFLSVVFLWVYIQYSLYHAVGYSTGFGIYLTVMSTIVMTLASLALSKVSSRSPYLAGGDAFIRMPRAHQELYPQSQEEIDKLTDTEVEDLLGKTRDFGGNPEPIGSGESKRTTSNEPGKGNPSFNF